MKILGIESTAHTFGVGVISNKGDILFDKRDMYSKDDGGIIPTEAAEHHKRVADEMIKEGLNFQPDLIAFSAGPGLSPCLHVGAKMAEKYGKDIIGINHCVAHLTSGLLFTKAKDPVYVYVSGANTQIIALEGGRFRIFGESLDVGLGNALDKFGREIGLGFPAGPRIEQLALKGKYIELPYCVKGMDVSFSGIVTKLSDLYKKGASKEDLCFSFQETAFAMLVEVTERALAHCDKKEIVLIGGVCANKRFVEMMEIMCKERNCKAYFVPLRYAGDNGVMIAWQGYLQRNSKINNQVRPYERTDEIDVDFL